MDFKLFRNSTFNGATLSNLLLNGVAGRLIASMMLLQTGGQLSAQQAGMLTLGYAIAIIAFIRVGEKLLKRFGVRKPMIWGSLIVGLSIALLVPLDLLLGAHKVLAVVSYTLFEAARNGRDRSKGNYVTSVRERKGRPTSISFLYRCSTIG